MRHSIHHIIKTKPHRIYHTIPRSTRTTIFVDSQLLRLRFSQISHELCIHVFVVFQLVYRPIALPLS